MLTGSQEYTIEVTGDRILNFPTFEIVQPSFPDVEKAEIVSSGERRVTVKVHFRQVLTLEDACSVSRLIAAQVADRLAYEYRIGAADPMRGQSHFQDLSVSGKSQGTVSHSISAFIAGHEVHTITAADITRLRPFIQSDEPNRDVYFSQLRWILGQDDPVAKFMHLYKILLSLEGGTRHNQKPVDDFIVARDASVQMVYNTFTKRNETCFTRLRNEVGHEIAGTTPATTRNGMEQHLVQLIEHVKAAIANIP